MSTVMNTIKIMDMYIHDLIKLTPSFNDFVGLLEYKELKKHWENSLSDEYLELTKQLYKTYLKLMKQQQKKDKKHNMQKSKDIDSWEKSFIYDLTSSLQLIDSPMIYMPINHLENPILGYIEMTLGDSMYDFDTVQDYKWFIQKTHEFEVWCQTAINRMKQGIQKKYVLPKLSVVRVIKQLKAALKNKEYMEHKIKIKLSFDFLHEIDIILTRLITTLLRFLEHIYLKHSPEQVGFYQYPHGKKFYKLFVKSETGINALTISQIHKLGLKEVNRIYKEIHSVMHDLKFNGTFKQFNDMIYENKSLKFKNEKDMDTVYKQLQKIVDKDIMKPLFPDKIKQNAIIKPVPSYMEDGAPAAYYMPGDLAGKRKGVFYYNSQSPTRTNKFEAEAMYLHEDSPGHHYQITLTNLNKKIPLFIRLLDNNAYCEGWGLYCENLGKYDNKYNYFGKLNMEMLRAIRLVVDTGLHYYGWSVEDCFSFFRKFSNSPEHEIESEVYRYIVDPAQALSYKIGEITLLQLRKEYMKKNKTLQEFHHDVLINGPLPLEILKQTMK